MSCARFLPCVLLLVALGLVAPVAAWAGITPYGDVTPFDTGTWSSWTSVTIGDSTAGTVNIDSASMVETGALILGNLNAGTGTLTVADNSMLSVPSDWNGITVGKGGYGILTISNGGTVSSDGGGITMGGYALVYPPFPPTMYYGSGTITVDGANSLLSSGDNIYVGQYGQGVLNISNGGHVSNVGTWRNGNTYLGYNAGASGSINFGGAGGTLSTGALYAAGTQLTGTGTINARGLVSDFNATFDSTASLNQTLMMNDITVNLDISDTDAPSDLGVGYAGTGTITISNGVTVTTAGSVLGQSAGSSGTVTVDGAGTNWIIGKNTTVADFAIGDAGSGTLKITNGASVQMYSNGYNFLPVYIGNSSSGSGAVTVDGSNSTWTGLGNLFVGSSGAAATLTISNGATVDSGSSMYSSVATTIGGGSSVTVTGSGSMWTSYNDISNYGALNILSGGQVDNSNCTTRIQSGGEIAFGTAGGTLSANSLYTAASDLSGTGAIQTHGLVGDGFNLVLNSNVHTFTAPGSNVGITLDLSDTNNLGDLGAGYCGNDSLTIQNGTIYSATGYMGFESGSYGTATVTATGQWNTGELYVGKAGTGFLFINNGGYVESQNAYISHEFWGEATVDGSGSKWKNTGDLYVGYGNYGFLYINNGGLVEVDGETFVGQGPYATGNIVFGGAGGTLTTKSLFATPGDLYGTGLIVANGSVCDSNVTFDNTNVGVASLVNSQGTITLNLDMSDPNNVASLGAGFWGNGVVTIKNGATVYSTEGHWGSHSSASGTVTVDNATWNASSDFYIGEEGTGLLQIANGATVNNATTHLGYMNSGVATVQNGGLWNHSGDMVVGFSEYAMPTGTLNINGGTVTDVNGYIGTMVFPWGKGNGMGTGNVTVGGAGSLWANSGNLVIGANYQEYGTLTINTGGTVTVGDTTIVSDSDMSGMGTVVFGGGTLETKSLYVTPSDMSGAGTINTRGLVSDVDLTFNSTTGLSQTVSVFGSVAVNLDLSNSADVGDLGAGYLGNGSILIDGVAVASANGYIGYKGGSNGVVTVTGTAGQWNVPQICIGGPDSMGYGTLNIQQGGTVATNGITDNVWGRVNFDGGVLTPYDSDNEYWIDYCTSACIAEGGAIFDTAGHDMRILGALQHGGSAATDGGIVKTGEGTLLLFSREDNFTGRATVEEGTLRLDGFDPSADPASWSMVLTGGGADVQGGKLVLGVFYGDPNGVLPTSEVAQLLTASYTGGTAPWTTGQFLCGTTGGTDTVHGLGWIENTEDMTVTVMYTLYGDSNLDGSVNGTDLNAVLSYYNQSSEIWSHGDFNYDGSVNGTDLNTVLSNYNQSLSSSTAAVPEPSTLLLMVLGVAGLLAWRKVRACTH